MKIDFSGSLNDQFASDVVQLPPYLLDDSVTWIQDNLSPDAVFTDEQLGEWAKNNGFVEEI